VYQEEGQSMLTFTLLGFNEVVGLSEELPSIVGLYNDGEFTGHPIPLPSTLSLLGIGLLSILGLKRRLYLG